MTDIVVCDEEAATGTLTSALDAVGMRVTGFEDCEVIDFVSSFRPVVGAF